MWKNPPKKLVELISQPVLKHINSLGKETQQKLLGLRNAEELGLEQNELKQRLLDE